MKSEKLTRGLAVILLLGVITVNCGVEQPWESLSDDMYTNTTTHYQSPVGDEITDLVWSDQQASLFLNNDDASSDVVMILYAADSDQDNITFEISSDVKSSSPFKSKALVKNFDSSLDFHQSLREIEQIIPHDEELGELSSVAFLTKNYQLGHQESFRVLNSFSSLSHDTVQAVLRYQNNDFMIYIDERDNEQYLDEEIQELGDNFASLVPLEREIFGDESDVNGDDRFVILMSHVVNELGAQQGGMVTGFFYALDLFNDKKYPFSNEREIIYTLTADDDGVYGYPVSKSFALKSILPGVLPHEFQHMINFNQHYFVRASAVEEGWLNEGLSHFAEDLAFMEDDVVLGYGAENPARVSDFLSVIDRVCFTCGINLAQRGGSYLFIKYLYEQAEKGHLSGSFDGQNLLSQLVQTAHRGKRNVLTAAYGDLADNSQFHHLLGQYGLSLYFSNTGKAPDDQYNFFGFKLRGNMDDYRGTYLQGPAVLEVSSLPFVGQMPATGLAYLQIPKNLIEQYAAQFNISLASGPDNIGGFLIQDK